MTGFRLFPVAVTIVLSCPLLVAQKTDAARIRDAVTRGFAAIQTAQRVSRATRGKRWPNWASPL